MAETDYLANGGYPPPPSIGASGRDQATYIRSILDPEHSGEESESGHHRIKDYFSPRRKEGEGEQAEKEGYWERHSLFRWVVYGLAAVGAWKLGVGYVAKSSMEAIRNHHKIEE